MIRWKVSKKTDIDNGDDGRGGLDRLIHNKRRIESSYGEKLYDRRFQDLVARVKRRRVDGVSTDLSHPLSTHPMGNMLIIINAHIWP